MAKRRSWTVATLAAASDLDIEQTLVALWSEGIEYPIAQSSRIRPEDVALAERAAGLAGARQNRVSYWMAELNVARDDLSNILSDAGLTLTARAQTLPKGAIRRLRGIQRASPEPDELPIAIRDRPKPPKFVWTPPGNTRVCDYLTVQEIRQVHEALTADFAESDDPIYPPGIKSVALLESAASRPSTSYGDQIKYPTVESAAAALLHSLVQNHPFHNGNKRSALVCMMVFLDRHNLVLVSDQNELFRFMIRVAAHDLLDNSFEMDLKSDREVAAIAGWIFKRSRPIRRAERSLTWREMSRKLSQLNCEIEQERGQKLRITRNVLVRRRLLRGDQYKKLESHFINSGDGREVPRTIVKKIRQELELDVEHGTDAEVFYGEAKGPDYFIAQYSTLLRRLARV